MYNNQFPSTSTGFHHAQVPVKLTFDLLAALCAQYNQQMQHAHYGYQHHVVAAQHEEHIESLEDSSPSEDGSVNSSPFVHNGTTYYAPALPDNLPATSRHPSEHFTEAEIHAIVSIYRASKDELKVNGYPMMVNGVPTIAPTKYTRGKQLLLNPGEKMRKCCRCHVDFELRKNGRRSQGECVFHPKGKVRDAVRGDVRLCCDEKFGLTDGCQMRRCHVFDQLLNTEMERFVRTEKPKGRKDKRSTNIFAIDCEMVYTINGPALARLTVVDWNGKVVLDVMVKPPSTVIDPNTEFSGLTIEDINAATDTLESCRNKFLQLVNEKTILVGHSLESDLKALRLVHKSVVDTSLLYLSNGFKVGLKKLALDYLGIQIQANNPAMTGHDSEEDARVSLDLLKLKMEMW